MKNDTRTVRLHRLGRLIFFRVGTNIHILLLPRKGTVPDGE